MRASSGIPGAFAPFELEGRLLVDGAVSRNLPAQDALRLGADVVICSDVSDPLTAADELGTLVDVLDQVITLSMRRSMAEQREMCDVLIRPDVLGLGGFAFDEYDEWIARGVSAARMRVRELTDIALDQGDPPPRASEPGTIADSVPIVRVTVQGAERAQTVRLVLDELALLPGEHVTADEVAEGLRDIDATGLFGIVRYRLEQVADGYMLIVHVQERPKDRLGVGLRYDDERRAALLFTTTLHNLVRYGSVTRLDLRIGEETRARAAYLRRHGITGRFEGGTSVAWSQSELPRPESLTDPVAGIDLFTLESFLGLVGERTTFFGLEVAAEWATSGHPDVPDVLLGGASAVFDHESLDRVDFPTLGTDASVKFEVGISDVVTSGSYSVFTADTRLYAPVLPRVVVDLGGFIGFARGDDLPLHRRFFLGGTHQSAVFARTQPTFRGLDSRELEGSVAQVGRAGIRLDGPRGLHLRFGAAVGGVAEEWRLPVRDRVRSWSVQLGSESLVGPVVLEWSRANDRSGRLSIGVGRAF